MLHFGDLVVWQYRYAVADVCSYSRISYGLQTGIEALTFLRHVLGLCAPVQRQVKRKY